MQRDLRIGEVASRTGRSVHTIRWYEQQGLLPGVTRDATGRRVYSEYHVGWLDLMDRLRFTGMSITQMRQYTALAKQGAAAAPGVTPRAPASGTEEHRALDGGAGPDRCQGRILRRVDGQWRKAGHWAAPAFAQANAKTGRSIVTARRSAPHARRCGGGFSTRSTSAVSIYSVSSRNCPAAMRMTKQ
jgi:DNA-binding transcriptional MerR regulator